MYIIWYDEIHDEFQHLSNHIYRNVGCVNICMISCYSNFSHSMHMQGLGSKNWWKLRKSKKARERRCVVLWVPCICIHTRGELTRFFAVWNLHSRVYVSCIRMYLSFVSICIYKCVYFFRMCLTVYVFRMYMYIYFIFPTNPYIYKCIYTWDDVHITSNYCMMIYAWLFLSPCPAHPYSRCAVDTRWCSHCMNVVYDDIWWHLMTYPVPSLMT